MVLELPRLRSDLRWTSDGAVDERFRRRLRPSRADARLLDALRRGERRVDRLARRLRIGPASLRRRVYALARDLWFDLPILEAYDALRAWTPPGEPPQALRDFREGPFLCTGCGKCCMHTDIGPVWRHEVERISARLPTFAQHTHAVTDALHVIESDARGCVYLDADGLCALHAAHDAAFKPSICRQFPYHFTVFEGEVRVTLDPECWDLNAALEAGAQDRDAARADLEGVWGNEPVVEHVPSVLFLAPFRRLETPTWARFAESVEAGLDAGEAPVESLRAAWRAVAPPLPGFLSARRWRQVFGRALPQGRAGLPEELITRLGALLDAWVSDGAAWRREIEPPLRLGLGRLGRAAPGEGTVAHQELSRLLRGQIRAFAPLKRDNLELGVISLDLRLRIAAAALPELDPRSMVVAVAKLQKDRRYQDVIRTFQLPLGQALRMPDNPTRSTGSRRNRGPDDHGHVRCR